jgi:hypothetical protein
MPDGKERRAIRSDSGLFSLETKTLFVTFVSPRNKGNPVYFYINARIKKGLPRQIHIIKVPISSLLLLIFLSFLKVLLKFNVDFDPMVIGADTRDSCLEKRVKEDPLGGSNKQY